MAAEDIKRYRFSGENQPKRRRTRKGIPNRATVYKNLLSLIVDAPDLQRGGYIKLTLYEAMALGQMRAAMHGNTRAWIEIQDSLFGNQAHGVNTNIAVEELNKLPDEELDRMIQKLNRGYVKAPTISIIEIKRGTQT